MTSPQDQTASRPAETSNRIATLRGIGIWGLMCLVILSAFRPPSLWRDGLLVGSLILLTLVAYYPPVAFLFAKSRSGTTRLNLGYLNRTPAWQVALSAIIGLACLLPFWSDALVLVTRIEISLYILIGSLLSIVVSFQPTLITDKGLYSPQTIIRWEQIAARQWLNQSEGVLLILQLKHRRWPFDEATLKIPASLKDAADTALAEKGLGPIARGQE